MIIYGDWRKIDSLCINCVVPLEGRPIWGKQPFIIKGCEPMEYRHTDIYGCKNPEVYSCWNKYADWQSANQSLNSDRENSPAG